MFQYDMYSTNINEIKVLKLSGHTSLELTIIVLQVFLNGNLYMIIISEASSNVQMLL